MLFSALPNAQYDAKMAALTGWEITWVFFFDRLHGKNNGLLFFVMVMSLSLFLLSYPSIHARPSRPLLAESDNIILIKSPTLGKHSVINARVY